MQHGEKRVTASEVSVADGCLSGISARLSEWNLSTNLSSCEPGKYAGAIQINSVSEFVEIKIM